MARGSRGGGPHGLRRPADLTGILSVAEKNDLATLVNAITEKMARDITNLFDSPTITPIQGDHGHHHWLLLPLLHHKENNPSPISISELPRGDGSKSYSKARLTIEREEKEAMTPQLRELKKEALIYFRKWQTTVMQRIRDIAVNDSTALPAATRGRGGRGLRGGSRGRGTRGGGGGRGNLTLAIGPPRAPPNHVDHDLAQRFSPLPNHLWGLELEKRKLLLHVVLLVLLSMQEYTANSRLLLLNLSSALNLPIEVCQDDEDRIAKGLVQTALNMQPEEALAQRSEEIKSSRRWKPGFSGIPAKLAAPLAAVAVGADLGVPSLTPAAAAGLLGTMADSAFFMGMLFGINASKPTSKMMETFSREIQDFALLSLHGAVGSEYLDAREVPAERRRLRMVIALGGFLRDGEDIIEPWHCLSCRAETFVLRWETSALANLGTSLETVIQSSAWSSAQEEIRARTIFSSLINSMWPLPLLKISKIMDNPWSVGMVRAEKAGAVLADAIMRQKFQGDRPVSLIGYSLAARTIYACLMVLAERRHFGAIDSVVMMGTPAPSESRVWLTLKSVVCGRLINVYSEHDYILGFLYRTSNIQFGVAGLQEIQGADGVENYKVRNLPKGHLSYQDQIGQILKEIGWEALNMDAIKTEKNRGGLRERKF